MQWRIPPGDLVVLRYLNKHTVSGDRICNLSVSQSAIKITPEQLADVLNDAKKGLKRMLISLSEYITPSVTAQLRVTSSVGSHMWKLHPSNGLSIMAVSKSAANLQGFHSYVWIFAIINTQAGWRVKISAEKHFDLHFVRGELHASVAL